MFYLPFKGVGQLRALWGAAVFEVAADGQEANVTRTQLSRAISKARQVGDNGNSNINNGSIFLATKTVNMDF